MIEINDVSFEYEKEQGTLSHIDLQIKQGECILLCGESGCGKTTVINAYEYQVVEYPED